MSSQIKTFYGSERQINGISMNFLLFHKSILSQSFDDIFYDSRMIVRWNDRLGMNHSDCLKALRPGHDNWLSRVERPVSSIMRLVSDCHSIMGEWLHDLGGCVNWTLSPITHRWDEFPQLQAITRYLALSIARRHSILHRVVRHSDYDANCFPSMNWHASIRLTIIGQIDSNFLRVIEKNSQFEEKSLKYCDLNKLFRYYIFSLLSSYLLLQIRASYFNLLLWNAGRIHFCRHTIVFIWKENNFFLLCSAPSFSRINFEFILIFFSHLIHPLCWKFSRFSIFSFFFVSLSHLNTTSI